MNNIDQALWNRLFAIFRQSVGDHATAEDLTQDLLLKLARNGGFERFCKEESPTERHLWNYIKKCAVRHLLNHFRSSRAARNEGWTRRVSLDEPEHACSLPVSGDPVGELQLRELESAIARSEQELKTEYERCGKAELFDALQPHLRDGRGELRVTYSRLASGSRIRKNTVRVQLSRARSRFRKMILRELDLAA